MTVRGQNHAADWCEIELGEAATFRTGPFGSTFHKLDYVVGGTPLINPSHIIDGQIVPDETVTVRPELAKQLGGFALREDEIVIGRRGDMGRCAVVKRRHVGFLCGTGSMIVRPRPGINPHLLQALLSSKEIIAKIEESSVGTTMINLNQGTLSSLKVRMPAEPEEQKAIAGALSDANALIEGLERLIAKKRLIKQGAMHDLLSAKRRLPGFSGKWSKTSLGEIGPFVGGGTPSMAKGDFWTDGTIPWVSSSDVRIGELHGSDRMITVAAVKGSSTRIVDSGAILFVTRSGILRRFQPVMINTVPVAINQDIKALLPRASSYFPSYVFQAAVAAGDQIIRDCIKTGTTVESIDINALRRFEIACPADKEEQKAIANVLNDMDTEIQTLEARLEKARQVKEGMMQNLLTGRIRLINDICQQPIYQVETAS